MPVAAGKDEQMLTLQEASARFNIPVPTLRIWRRLGQITRYERGDGRAVVDAEEIEQRVADRKAIRRLDDQPASEETGK